MNLSYVFNTAPAHVAVEYEDRVFTSNILTQGPVTEKTIYSGRLSEENNAAWKHLTRGTYMPYVPLLSISKCGKPSNRTIGGMVMFDEEVEKWLPNRTAAYLKEPGKYFGNMEMFHSLHCVVCLLAFRFHRRTDAIIIGYAAAGSVQTGWRRGTTPVLSSRCVDRDTVHTFVCLKGWELSRSLCGISSPSNNVSG